MDGSQIKKIIYTAEFVVDVKALLKKFPPKHEKVFGHHSTIAFKPDNLNSIEIGKKSLIKIIARAYDEKGDALFVENPKSKNENPHITLSCAQGTTPSYSNELLKKAIESGSIKYFESPEEIEVVEGYFNGTEDIIN